MSRCPKEADGVRNQTIFFSGAFKVARITTAIASRTAETIKGMKNELVIACSLPPRYGPKNPATPQARGLKHHNYYSHSSSKPSRPSRARGLKRCYNCRRHWCCGVAPLTGAWIETLFPICYVMTEIGRAPHGRVD